MSMAEGKRQNQYKTSAMALDEEKIPFVEKSSTSDRLLDFDAYNQYSIHFDARLLAQFLEDTAIGRGVQHVDGTVSGFVLNNEGDISSIILEDGRAIESDFIFDASGFSRLTNKKVFNTEWISFSENLPAKKAVPFFLDIDQDNIPAYTESTAMNYGWMWKIPLQHRYGCGYVFDSNFITEEEAKLEIEEYLGHEIKSPKTFVFDPGYYKTVWNKNTIAVGLSGGFVEPLEATSIMQTVKVLEVAFRFEFDLLEKNKEHVDALNKMYAHDCEEIRDFLYLHYMTNKTNTEFWRDFTKNNKMPESLKQMLEDLNSYTHKIDEESIFPDISWYIVMHGNKILDLTSLKKMYDSYISLTEEIRKILSKRIIVSNYFIKHSEFLKRLGGLNENN